MADHWDELHRALELERVAEIEKMKLAERSSEEARDLARRIVSQERATLSNKD